MADRFLSNDAKGVMCVRAEDYDALVQRFTDACAKLTELGVIAERYRFLREPGNAIVYAKDPNAWGSGQSGHVRYDTAEQLDTAIDAAIIGSAHPTTGDA